MSGDWFDAHNIGRERNAEPAGMEDAIRSILPGWDTVDSELYKNTVRSAYLRGWADATRAARAAIKKQLGSDMSSYFTKVRNKKTGEEFDCMAHDDYHGHRRYGYQISTQPQLGVLTQKQFDEDWEELCKQGSCTTREGGE